MGKQIKGILGTKLGMTQVFNEAGQIVPVTVVQAGPCVVVQRRTKDKDGYDAVQLGLVEFIKPQRVTKALTGHFKKAYDASDELRILTNGYQSVVHFQAQQTAACQALHQVGPRMCRWLLQAQDAVGGDTLQRSASCMQPWTHTRSCSVVSESGMRSK